MWQMWWNQASKISPLLNLQQMRVYHGSPLSLGEQLCWIGKHSLLPSILFVSHGWSGLYVYYYRDNLAPSWLQEKFNLDVLLYNLRYCTNRYDGSLQHLELGPSFIWKNFYRVLEWLWLARRQQGKGALRIVQRQSLQNFRDTQYNSSFIAITEECAFYGARVELYA